MWLLANKIAKDRVRWVQSSRLTKRVVTDRPPAVNPFQPLTHPD